MSLGQRDPEVQRTLNSQNIFLKDRKITNVVIENKELKEHNAQLLDYNNELRDQLEQVLAKLQEGHGGDPELVEEISIFQNKMAVNYPQKILDQVRNRVGGLEQSQKEGSGQQNTINEHATWNIGPGGATISSTIDANMYDQKEYTKKLEESVNWLEEKLAKATKEIKKLKQENSNLKASNENHIFINDKLNKALKKSEQRIEGLSKQVKALTDKTVVFAKSSDDKEAEDHPFQGDVSSIMIRPDQYKDFVQL